MAVGPPYVGFFVLAMLSCYGSNIVILKSLYLIKWSRMAMVDDYFLATLLNMWNVMFSALLTAIRLVMGESETNQYVVYLTNSMWKPEESLHKAAYFWTSLFPVMAHAIISTLGIAFVKGFKIIKYLKTRAQVQNSPNAVHLNNVAHNENIVSYESLAVLLLCLTFSLVTHFNMTYFEEATAKGSLLFIWFVFSTFTMLLPTIYFIKRPSNFKKAWMAMFD